MAYLNQGNHAKATEVFKQTFATRERTVGRQHPDTMISANNLALALNCQRQFPEAACIFRENLILQRRVLGAAHPETLTTAGNLASTLFQQGQLDEAAELLQETLSIRRRVLGADNPMTRTNEQQLVVVLAAIERAHAVSPQVTNGCIVEAQ